MILLKHSNNYKQTLECTHVHTHHEREKEKRDMYINGVRKGFAKNGNTVENPYKQRNDSNLVEKKKSYIYEKSGSKAKERRRENVRPGKWNRGKGEREGFESV